MKSFHESLSDEEKLHFREFSQPEEMIADMIQLTNEAEQKNRLLECCIKIDRFAKRLEPLFEVVHVLAAINPTYAHAAWGAIRLIFLVFMHVYVLFAYMLSNV